jgi:hypothetical protein
MDIKEDENIIQRNFIKIISKRNGRVKLIKFTHNENEIKVDLYNFLHLVHMDDRGIARLEPCNRYVIYDFADIKQKIINNENIDEEIYFARCEHEMIFKNRDLYLNFNGDEFYIKYKININENLGLVCEILDVIDEYLNNPNF